MFDHFWFNSGYVELNYALWPIHDKDAFSGPFTASKSAPTVLEVATTYDPATPFRGAKRLATAARQRPLPDDGRRRPHRVRNGSPTCIDADDRRATSQTLALPRQGHGLQAGVCRSCRRRRGRDAAPAGAGTRSLALHCAERRAAGACATASAVPCALGAPHQAPSAYACAHTRAAPRHAARAGAGRCPCGACRGCARRPSPRAARPRGRSARPRRATRSAATSRNAPGSTVARSPLQASPGQVEVVAPEAERVRAAGAVDDAGVGRPVVGGLLPPGRRAVEAAVGGGARAAQRAVGRERDQQALPVVVVVAAQRGQRQVAGLRVGVVRPELARPGPPRRARRGRAARAPRARRGRTRRGGSSSTRAPRRRRR